MQENDDLRYFLNQRPKFKEENQTAAQREAHEELGLSDLKLEFAGVLAYLNQG